ncbi:MAG: hypothetical protein EOP02_06870 [Proteobacteria bacterium]|nr:MAG: hypothetical protein EOP02_06870 [Pseudomonadota bacterium]
MESRTRPRRAKVFGEGPAWPLDRNAKARIMVHARALNARLRQPGQHQGPLTRVTLEVLKALLWRFHNAHTGRCFPSYKAIAAKTGEAGCARSSVGLAIQALEATGILSWANRLARIRERCIDATGKTVWHARIIRTSNAYAFHDPVENRGKPPISSKSENQAGSFYQDLKDSSVPVGESAEHVDKHSETAMGSGLLLA